MTLEQAINRLQQNDPNGTWNEVESIEELKECLLEAMTGYEETEETYLFYQNILNQI